MLEEARKLRGPLFFSYRDGRGIENPVSKMLVRELQMIGRCAVFLEPNGNHRTIMRRGADSAVALFDAVYDIPTRGGWKPVPKTDCGVPEWAALFSAGSCVEVGPDVGDYESRICLVAREIALFFEREYGRSGTGTLAEDAKENRHLAPIRRRERGGRHLLFFLR